MAPWVQRHNGAMSATAAALLRTEVGDEAGPWAAWAKRAGRPSGLGSGVGLGWPVGQGQKVAEPVEEGRGTRGGRVGREGQAGWAERAKKEELFGLDFKWALSNKI
jgi:hypothetical protein